MEAQEFFVGLNDNGVNLSKVESEQLLASLDTNGDGNVNYDQFLCSIRGEMNKERADVTMAAFAKFDTQGANSIKASDLRVAVNVSSHPKVVSGELTEDEAFLEFLTNFGDKNNDGKVTVVEWVDYYSAVSSSIASDEHFCNLMKVHWNL